MMLYLVKQKKVAEHIKEFFAMKSLHEGLVHHYAMLHW